MRPSFPLLLCLSTAGFAAAQTGPSPDPAKRLERFESEVRPILANRCFSCHGPEKQRSELRLDHIEHILRGGERGPAIVPGNVEASRLALAIGYTEPALQMPPKQRLPDAERDVLLRWIHDGAPWPDEPVPQAGKRKPKFDLEARKAEHWAWRDLDDAPAPNVPTSQATYNEIDSFLLSKLSSIGLQFAEETDRTTLLRRVTLDTTGLLPTTAERDAFLADTSESAFERVVDRLLASPRFGQHWARHWLDLMRYAESLGHEFDYAIPHAWRYRDYVVRALNADVPYDQLVREHIAGDLLEEPRRHPEHGFNESMIGTAHWWFSEQTHSPVDVRQHTSDRNANQIDVITKSFLGLTVACARCHDHKFDAISTKDYYALSGFLKSSRYLQRDVAAPRDPQLVDAAHRAGGALAQAWRTRMRRAADSIDAEALRKAFDKHRLRATPERSDRDFSPNAKTFVDFRDANFDDWFVEGRAFGDGPTEDQTFVAGEQGTALIDGRWANSAAAGARAQGVLHSPSFDIDQPFLHVYAQGQRARINIVVEGFQVIRNPIYGRLKQTINSPLPRWYTVDLRMWQGRRASLLVCDQEPRDFGSGGSPRDSFVAVQRIVFSDTERAPPPPRDVPTEAFDDIGVAVDRAIDAWGAGILAPSQVRLLNVLWAEKLIEPGIAVEDAAARFAQANDRIPGPMFVPAIADGDGDDHAVYIRGGHRNEGDIVPRRFLTALGGEEPAPHRREDGSGRRRLAEETVDNPFASRVIVNRLWHHVFGRGIVPTVDNFGVLGQPPSHPELLDWLARRFIDDGWSIKRALRRMLVSRAYRSTSAASAGAVELDPENVHLHRASVRRMTSESVRDVILQLSTRLDDKLEGPAVPTHLTRHMTGRGRPRSGPLDGHGRRSLYLSVTRNFLSPFLLAFDTPLPADTRGRRDVTNVPAQALALLNDPFVIAEAKRWAEATREIQDHAERVVAIFERAMTRRPSPSEERRLVEFVRSQAETHGCGIDDVKPWADLCHALINAKEFLYIR